MRGTLKKINFFVEEDIRKALDELVPDGQKSKVINESLRKELLRIKKAIEGSGLASCIMDCWDTVLNYRLSVEKRLRFCYG